MFINLWLWFFQFVMVPRPSSVFTALRLFFALLFGVFIFQVLVIIYLSYPFLAISLLGIFAYFNVRVGKSNA